MQTTRLAHGDSKSAALSNAVPFNMHLKSSAEEVEKFAKYLFDTKVQEAGRAKYYKIADAIICITLNVFCAYVHDEKRLCALLEAVRSIPVQSIQQATDQLRRGQPSC